MKSCVRGCSWMTSILRVPKLRSSCHTPLLKFLTQSVSQGTNFLKVKVVSRNLSCVEFLVIGCLIWTGPKSTQEQNKKMEASNSYLIKLYINDIAMFLSSKTCPKFTKLLASHYARYYKKSASRSSHPACNPRGKHISIDLIDPHWPLGCFHYMTRMVTIP